MKITRRARLAFDLGCYSFIAVTAFISQEAPLSFIAGFYSVILPANAINAGINRLVNRYRQNIEAEIHR